MCVAVARTMATGGDTAAAVVVASAAPAIAAAAEAMRAAVEAASAATSGGATPAASAASPQTVAAATAAMVVGIPTAVPAVVGVMVPAVPAIGTIAPAVPTGMPSPTVPAPAPGPTQTPAPRMIPTSIYPATVPRIIGIVEPGVVQVVIIIRTAHIDTGARGMEAHDARGVAVLKTVGIAVHIRKGVEGHGVAQALAAAVVLIDVDTAKTIVGPVVEVGPCLVSINVIVGAAGGTAAALSITALLLRRNEVNVVVLRAADTYGSKRGEPECE